MTDQDRIESIDLSLAFLPLATPVSDAKVLTGRQRPLTRVAFLFARVRTADGAEGLGFSYSKRAGGPGLYAHAREIAPELIGEDPSAAGRRDHAVPEGGGPGRATQAQPRTALRDGAARAPRRRLPA
jgi:L-alanine-DL-glutamate epimerase-like enolase superfamily enzyme